MTSCGRHKTCRNQESIFWPTEWGDDHFVGRREHNLLATALELFQERGETFRDSLLDGIVLGPEPYPDCPQPWASSQDVTMFGLARPRLPVLAATDS
jgi:hypothetical protein